VEVQRYQDYRESVPSQRLKIEDMLRKLEVDGMGDSELEKLMAEGEAQAESAMEKGRAQGETASAMAGPPAPGGEARGQSTGTAGFKTVPRSQISGREAGSKSRGDFCKPIYDQVYKRVQSAYISKDPQAASTALAKAKSIKKQNFESAHVCAKLLKAHDEKQLT